MKLICAFVTRRISSVGVLLVLGVSCSSCSQTSLDQHIRADEIQAHVNFLASDELMGRHYLSAEARRAADYIAQGFARAGLAPLGADGTYLLPIEDANAAPNVAGVYRGRGAGYVLITAHYDHLAPATTGEDRIYNGADDNASGVAAVLCIADALAKTRAPTTASIVLVAFTGEEEGLLGSLHFARTPPFPLTEIRGVFNMDMISRGEENLIFVEGGAKAPRPLAAVEAANRRVGLTIRYGTHPEYLVQSDQYPFLLRGVPALYFGVEDHADYHQVTDHADKILPNLAARVARLVVLAAVELANDEQE